MGARRRGPAHGGVRRGMVRAVLLLGVVAALALPTAAWAQQSPCTAAPATNNSGYVSYVPTSYSAYSGFASFPGGLASGLVPAGFGGNNMCSAASPGSVPGAQAVSGTAPPAGAS